MALSNHERVGKAMEFLKAGLGPYIEREFTSLYKKAALAEAQKLMTSERLDTSRPLQSWDVAALLRLMWDSWNEVFRKTLGQAERTLVSELRDVRNKWAHQEPFSSDDAYRALDSTGRLLTAVSAKEAQEVEKMKMELLRVRFDEQMRTEKRKTAGTAIETQATGQLTPWREVVSPHKDVASGRYQQAEFAADLWQVHIGEGTDEYKSPAEFFRRTYLTESLKQLLVSAVRRLASGGGDPVVQLQTNFGGGKTHSMLALYHLFSGAAPGELAGIDAVLKEAESSKLPKAKRVVLVGNKISPGNPSTKADGTVVRTLWGELAWQLGGKAAFAKVKADDEKATSPGDTIRALFNEYGPCLVLIDEWVAYARQLHDQSDLPAGSFETQFSFAQALTESAKLAKNCLLVISLPASDTAGSPHTQADDSEVGGQRGREALDRLRNVIGRVESSWRPASAEEGFEIVRRRLFEPLVDQAQFVARDTVAREFANLYRTQAEEFPPETRSSDYEKRLKAAYPIHPEIFDRLYSDWSTLVKFQRTRGVLRLPEAYQWLLVPTQGTPQAPVEWQTVRLTGQDALAVRASKKLRNDELLVTSFAASRLRMELDRVPLWRGDHVAIKQVVEDFARYLYLPRLRDPSVLLEAVRGGFALITWERDGFAFGESFDEASGRYRGLRTLQQVPIGDASAPGLLVRPEVARKQLDAEKPPEPAPASAGVSSGGSAATASGSADAKSPTPMPIAKTVRRFHGNVALDPSRVGRDAGRIADEVVSHLAGLIGSKVRVTLEVEAEFADGVSEQVVRTVTENSRTLKFTHHGFEAD